MIPAEQHLGNFPPAKLRRPRVMRILQQLAGKGFILRRLRITQHARQQAHHRIRHHQRGQRPVGQHIVTNGNLLIDQMVRHPLIHPLVVAGNKNQMPLRRQPPRRCLVEACSRGGHQHHPRIRTTQRLQRQAHRFDLQHHPRAATVRWLIRHPMFPRRPIPQVAHTDLRRALLPRNTQHAFAENSVAHRRKQSQDVDFHASLVA